MNTTGTDGWHLLVSEDHGYATKINWGDDSTTVGWRCFDMVPYADRVAATSQTNDLAEFYAATQCGKLFVRRILPYGQNVAWSHWTPFSLPTSRSFALDVAASMARSGTNYVFVIDRGRVFQRHRLGPDAAFSDWKEVVAPKTQLLAAGLRADGRQQVFVVDYERQPWSCVQVSPEPGADFETCVDFASADVPPLVHITAPYRVLDGSPVFALDIDGTLWARFQNASGVFGAWQSFQQDAPGPFSSIAGAHAANSFNDLLRIAAITRSGSVYMKTRRGGVWGPWELLP
ncbi:MAG TPA: hypothetical protein VFZ53_30020 [Polyangiaceae bacterium]